MKHLLRLARRALAEVAWDAGDLVHLAGETIQAAGHGLREKLRTLSVRIDVLERCRRCDVETTAGELGASGLCVGCTFAEAFARAGAGLSRERAQEGDQPS